MAKPEKKVLPVSRLSIEISSSKLAPAQNALSPEDFRKITLTSSRFPNEVIVCAISFNSLQVSYYSKDGKNLEWLNLL